MVHCNCDTCKVNACRKRAVERKSKLDSINQYFSVGQIDYDTYTLEIVKIQSLAEEDRRELSDILDRKIASSIQYDLNVPMKYQQLEKKAQIQKIKAIQKPKNPYFEKLQNLSKVIKQKRQQRENQSNPPHDLNQLNN